MSFREKTMLVGESQRPEAVDGRCSALAKRHRVAIGTIETLKRAPFASRSWQKFLVSIGELVKMADLVTAIRMK
jgi:hypothetical protein